MSDHVKGLTVHEFAAGGQTSQSPHTRLQSKLKFISRNTLHSVCNNGYPVLCISTSYTQFIVIWVKTMGGHERCIFYQRENNPFCVLSKINGYS